MTASSRTQPKTCQTYSAGAQESSPTPGVLHRSAAVHPLHSSAELLLTPLRCTTMLQVHNMILHQGSGLEITKKLSTDQWPFIIPFTAHDMIMC